MYTKTVKYLYFYENLLPSISDKKKKKELMPFSQDILNVKIVFEGENKEAVSFTIEHLKNLVEWDFKAFKAAIKELYGK